MSGSNAYVKWKKSYATLQNFWNLKNLMYRYLWTTNSLALRNKQQQQQIFGGQYVTVTV